MLALLAKRLLQALLVAWGVGTLTFIMMRHLPGDFAFRIAAGRYGYDQVDATAAAQVRSELGLDRPALELYGEWLWDLLQFNLGNSLISGAPVMDELEHQLTYSIWLALVALIFSICLAFPLGIASAYKPNSWLDRSLLAISSLLRATPSFVLGLVLILLFALHWQLLPVAGFETPSHIILPAFALALTLAAVSSRIVRNASLEVFNASYYHYAQLKGLTPQQSFWRHGLRNLLVPSLTFMGTQLIGLIEGIVMIESLFSWPGIGHGLAHAVFGRDIPMIQGTALMMGLLFVGLNALIDVVCYALDPRIHSRVEQT